MKAFEGKIVRLQSNCAHAHVVLLLVRLLVCLSLAFFVFEQQEGKVVEILESSEGKRNKIYQCKFCSSNSF